MIQPRRKVIERSFEGYAKLPSIYFEINLFHFSDSFNPLCNNPCKLNAIINSQRYLSLHETFVKSTRVSIFKKIHNFFFHSSQKPSHHI